MKILQWASTIIAGGMSGNYKWQGKRKLKNYHRNYQYHNLRKCLRMESMTWHGISDDSFIQPLLIMFLLSVRCWVWSTKKKRYDLCPCGIAVQYGRQNYQINKTKGQHTFSLKGQRVNTQDFVHLMVCHNCPSYRQPQCTTTQVWICKKKKNTKLFLQRWMENGFKLWAVVCQIQLKQ